MVQAMLITTRCGCQTFAPVAAFMFVIAGIFTVFLVMLLAMLMDMWPGKIYPAGESGKAAPKKPRERCDHCGYDLRFSPDYCPECGAGYDTFRKVSAGVRVPRPSRSIVFRALPGGAHLLLTVPRQLRETLGRLFGQRPGDIDLLFGESGGEGEKLTSAQELQEAVARTMALTSGDPACRELFVSLRRLNHFAKAHPYARIVRSVNGQSRSR